MLDHDPCQTVHDALERHDCQPRGPVNKFVARCPAHQDRLPSLSVAEGTDGRAVLHCHAGCETANVIAALGLTWSDLFPEGHRQARSSRRPRLVSEPAISSVERVLDAAGIVYRQTTNPHLVVADECPACWKPELWIFDDGRQLRASCWTTGCSTEAILMALRQDVTGEAQRVAA